MIEIHHNRKTIRLKDYDYSQNGMYYVTICTKNREPILTKIKINSKICRGRVPPLPDTKQINIIKTNTAIGIIIENAIKNINQINNIKIHRYVIMPDHIHFIVQLYNPGRGGTMPIQSIVGRFKSYTTIQYNILNKTIGMKLWQRNYYEHIIRNEKEYNQICEYIKNNPVNYINNHFT